MPATPTTLLGSILCRIIFFLLLMSSAIGTAAEPQTSTVMTWSLRDEFRADSKRENPNTDRDEQATWHFLRTTGIDGPVETRQSAVWNTPKTVHPSVSL